MRVGPTVEKFQNAEFFNKLYSFQCFYLYLQKRKNKVGIIETNIQRILELCKCYKVKSLYVFGSILTSRFRKDSDVDFLVKFDKEKISLDEYADNYFDFQFALEDIFNRKVDLVCDDAIKNPYFRREVDAKKKLIYG